MTPPPPGKCCNGCFHIFTSTCTSMMVFAMYLVLLGLPESPYPILHPPSSDEFCCLPRNMAAPVNDNMLGMVTALLRATRNMHVVLRACMPVNMCILHRM